MEKANKIRDVMSKDIPASDVKPSELLEVALHDMKIIDKDPRYSFDMTTWHYPLPYDDQESGECEVCMAGSIMAARLMPDACGKRLFPESFPRETDLKLQAVDYIRRFNIESALSLLQNIPINDLYYKFNADQKKVVTKYFNHRSLEKMFLNSDYEDIIQDPMKYIKGYEKLLEELKNVSL